MQIERVGRVHGTVVHRPVRLDLGEEGRLQALLTLDFASVGGCDEKSWLFTAVLKKKSHYPLTDSRF